ncbi:MAG: NADH/ubiquinone/plastoquinone (complex I) [Elusimicrobia bacterium HGW-Elusimicrobia-2]|nr:MAG: NADH/ubiquinone/plastoquinone (complex I) [Elusimicrobia bacterium HGW-Elusimicrobia-2]
MERYIYLILLPLGGAFIIAALNAAVKSRDTRDITSDIIANLITLAMAGIALTSFGINGSYSVGGWPVPLGINIAADGFSILMLATVNTIAFCATLYSINYMDQYTSKSHYYSLFLLMLTGMNGVLLSGDLFNLFVFIEIASISSYALVGFGTEAEELEASFKYMVMGGIASTFILLAVAILYSSFGVLNMANISQAISVSSQTPLLKFSLFLFIAAFSIKAAIIPFHAWLPDAHPAAPAPVSAMLSGVLIKTLGIYAMTRIIMNIFAADVSILAPLGIISIMLGVLLALGQTDMKRLFAYHSVSQVGYIILGISLGTPLGILGGLFHLVNHSIFKSLLFLNSGAVAYRLGTRELNEMGGLNKVMPITGGTSFIASLSIAGMPPFNGFFSKLIIILACVQSGHPGFALWAVAGSILTLSSFMKVQKFAFFGKLAEKHKQIKEAPLMMSISVVILAVLCIATSLLVLPKVKNIVLQPAVDAVLSGAGYAKIIR